MKTALVVAGVLAAPFALVAAVLLLSTPLSWSGNAYVVAALALVAGAALAKKRWSAWVRRGALALFALTVGARLASGAGGRTIEMTVESTSGARGSARVVGRLVEERDVALSGARALEALHLWNDPDTRGLVPVMRDAYDAMGEAEGDVPSPALGTYTLGEGEGAFDLLVVRPPPGAPSSTTAVLFLHGFAGNFTLPCWRFAQPLARRGVVVACPSTTWQGRWWEPRGEAIARAARARLVEQGARRVILGGLSNGAIGASLLAPRMRGSFDGLVLVSGADPGAPCAGVPTLVLHGRDDRMTSAGVARGYAARCGGRYVDLDAGHFAMLVRAREVDAALGAFFDRAAPPRPTARRLAPRRRAVRYA